MMQFQPLQLGDHVRTIVPIVDLPTGVHGIIRAIFPLGDLYDVFFSDGIGLRIVQRSKLERLTPPQDGTAASST